MTMKLKQLEKLEKCVMDYWDTLPEEMQENS
jgi:hypothetical protein